MNVFTAAGQLYHALSVAGTPLVVDHTGDGAAVRSVADFLMRTVFAPSLRTKMSSAETCFILCLWQRGKVNWPETFSGTKAFLYSLFSFVTRIPLQKKVQRLWRKGYLFFGPRVVIEHAMSQLGLDTRGFVLISASYTFFKVIKTPRNLTHLCYYLNGDRVEPIEMVARHRALCAVRQISQYFCVLQEQIKYDSE